MIEIKISVTDQSKTSNQNIQANTDSLMVKFEQQPEERHYWWRHSQSIRSGKCMSKLLKIFKNESAKPTSFPFRYRILQK